MNLVTLVDKYQAKMAIKAFDVAMLEDNIIPVASVTPMDFFHYSWQHGIDIFITATQIYAIMEFLALINRICPIAIFGVLF